MKFISFCLLILLFIGITILSNKIHNSYNALIDEAKHNARNSAFKIIPVAKPIPLSYKTKDEIYNLRKEAVKKSIFNSPEYQPSEEVFGEIEDKKPWIRDNICVPINTLEISISGNSEEARFILNPSALVMIDYPFINGCEENKYIAHENASEIKYNSEKNEILVTYDMLNIPTLTNQSYYKFSGLNARDLGYKYGYIDKLKSTFELKFVNDENIGNSVTEFQDYLHTGSSCRHKGGCNNGSPLQPMLHFANPYIQNSEYKLDKEIYIKLWKNEPNSESDKPDIVERIIFRYS